MFGRSGEAQLRMSTPCRSWRTALAHRPPPPPGSRFDVSGGRNDVGSVGKGERAAIEAERLRGAPGGPERGIDLSPGLRPGCLPAVVGATHGERSEGWGSEGWGIRNSS